MRLIKPSAHSRGVLVLSEVRPGALPAGIAAAPPGVGSIGPLLMLCRPEVMVRVVVKMMRSTAQATHTRRDAACCLSAEAVARLLQGAKQRARFWNPSALLPHLQAQQSAQVPLQEGRSTTTACLTTCAQAKLKASRC